MRLRILPRKVFTEQIKLIKRRVIELEIRDKWWITEVVRRIYNEVHKPHTHEIIDNKIIIIKLLLNVYFLQIKHTATQTLIIIIIIIIIIIKWRLVMENSIKNICQLKNSISVDKTKNTK